MKALFQEQKWFYIPYAILFMVGGFFLIRFSKTDIHLWINQFHSDFFDFFFRYLTELGNGIFLPVFLILLILLRFRHAVYMTSVFLISGLLVQILKRFVFYNVDRPLHFFGETTPYHWVEGVERLCCHSFPSGHSATAFAFYFCFAVVSGKKWIKIAMFVLACLVAFSRVYLSQHFLTDIMAGSFIGIVTATALYPWIYSLKYPWMDQNIRTVIPGKSK